MIPTLRPLAAALAVVSLAAGAALADSTPEARLGRDVVPTFQQIRLRLDPDRRHYSGSVHVALDVKQPTATVQFHADGQKLERIALVQAGDTLSVTRASGDDGLVTLTAARPLARGAATLDIAFTHLYGTRAVGLYRVVVDGRGYLFTQFESTDARQAFPCWDEPCFKFPYQITLELPSGQQALSNTPVASRDERDGWQTIAFEKTPPLPSYLLAVAVGPLEFTPVAGMRVPTRIVTVRGQSRLAALAAEMTPKLVAGLERWFGQPYPFEKLDLVAVPDFAYGAMENPGAITFRDDALLVDPATVTVEQRRRVASVACHELSHMWFGDLVTMAWWDDLWLNESFANWMAAKVTDEVFPEFKDGLANLQTIQNVKAGDAQPSTRAIRDRTTGGEAGLSNVGLVYSKGNAVLSMFESYLGPATFQKGVRAYLKAHAWGNATASDLWRALDQASGTDVSAAMASFTDQPGVPLLRVVPAPGGVRLTQSRCSPDGVSQPPLRWRIPITLRYPAGGEVRTARVLLTDESQVVPLPGAGSPAWVMPNGGGAGWYAWSVPDAWLRALAAAAPTAMSAAERVAFLGNLNLLLDAGEVHGDALFEALSHFGNDAEPQVVASTMAQLGSVRTALVPDSLADAFAVYVRRTLGPALARIGETRRPGEDEDVSLMRGQLIEWMALRGHDEKTIAFAREQALRYFADSSSVDPGIADAVVRLAASHGDAAMFDEIQKRFEAARVPAIRRRYLAALGAFQDSTLAARAYQFGLTDAVRGSEFTQLFMGAAGRDDAARQRLWRWMTAHYDAIAQRIPPPALRFLPMMGSGCSEEQLAATLAFYQDPQRASVPGIAATLERLKDNTRTCIGLRDREGPGVGAYLRGMAAN